MKKIIYYTLYPIIKIFHFIDYSMDLVIEAEKYFKQLKEQKKDEEELNKQKDE